MEVPAAERHIVQANLPAWRMLKNLQVQAQEDASEALYKKLADKMARLGYAVNTAAKARAMGIPSSLIDLVTSRVQAAELRARRQRHAVVRCGGRVEHRGVRVP